MKNFLLPLVGFFALSLSFFSCNKCQDCTFMGVTEEICQDDFDSKDEYEASITLAESWGATCK
ncbi:MAG: hypothetical protein C0594_11090 [Marinilabiliales bacterium]|nr:MAG: hypothetical protein C0594_11090 [Marinilabiliales bacterium]